MYSLHVHQQERRQVAEMSVAGLMEVGHAEAAAGHIQEEYMVVALEPERPVDHSFVCFVEMRFDLAGVRPGGTCPDYILPVLEVPTFEAPPAIRRIGLFSIVAAEVRKIRSEMRKPNGWVEVVVFEKVAK